MATLVLEFKNRNDDKAKYNTFYSHSKLEVVTDETDIKDNLFKSIYTTIISNIKKF